MGALFRSEEMALCQLFIQPEAAYSSVSMLGETGIVQFRDLNASVNTFHRKFVSEVRRCDELERKLRYIEGEVCKDGVNIPESQVVPKAPNPREIIDLEVHLEKTEMEILELSQNAVNLKSNFVELKELKHVLEKTQVFLTEQEEADSSRALIGGDDRGRLGFVAGVVQRERVHAFERMLWRISRGNVFVRQAELEDPIEDPASGNHIYKTVFVAFFQGENLKSRVKKVCAGFHASTYPCPNTSAERMEMVNGVRGRLEDLNLVLNQTRDHRQRVLSTVAKELPNWGVMVRKMKAIYHTLNMFNMDVTKKCLIGECWVPTMDLSEVRKALADGGKAVGSSIPSFVNVIETSESPPTFVRTNKFTAGFQTLIDAYAVSSYREANPALYTIVTFPFLFAVMFGDMGHGLIVTLFAAFMVLNEKRYLGKKGGGEIWTIFFGGRYIILLMGIFSIYTGLIYNDIFSVSLNLFGSAWGATRYPKANLTESKFITLDPAFDYFQQPYPLGMDPVWQPAKNKIIFLNSFKMKLSIIFGVVHMIFGVIVSVINHVHFNKKINIVLEFMPQVLFLVLLFGYLAFLMFFKWIVYMPNADPLDLIKYKASPTCAPSVLISFINMMLFGSNEAPKDCDPYMFPFQEEIQRGLVVLALLCIPWMLLGKPMYILMTRRARKYDRSAINGDLNQGVELQAAEDGMVTTDNRDHGDHDEEEHEFGEIMIHQGIHTVEYVLSTVSHTASYLRLWALSLAHAQLSEVLWSMVLRKGFLLEHYVGSVMLFVVFAFWAFFTVAILVMMEGLSAFLHTLRLHWVEFMSKFYVGAGYAFQPFSFKDILEPSEEDAD